jgi:poly-gamma-glutamate capsule biosynthesis protein CapA/YwtB (metallophosphatase superfamily)
LGTVIRRSLLIAFMIVSLVDGRTAAADAPRQEPIVSTNVTIAAVGDILFGRYGEDKTYLPVPHVPDPFAELAPELRAADLAFCNIESPVVPEPRSFGVFKRMTFRADPEKMKLVADAGFDVVSLANNHMFNMKAQAVPETVANVAAAGLRPGGAGRTPADAMRPVVVDVRGVRVAFLMFTVWNNTGKSGFTKDGSLAFFEHEGKLEATAVAEIRAARRYLGADFVIVSIHWGLEYHDHPHRGQEQLAAAMREAGADLVLGHHPHVAQDIRYKRGQAVVFSMGNFLFDNPSLDRRESMIFHATLSQPGPLRHVSNVELEPIMIDRQTRAPGFARGKDYARWSKRLGKLAPGVTVRPERPLAAATPTPVAAPSK